MICCLSRRHTTKRWAKSLGKLIIWSRAGGPDGIIPCVNAEVAVKPFAIHRNNMNSLHTQKGIEEYLILLSIRQTCKYQNLSFWEFLKSKRTTL